MFIGNYVGDSNIHFSRTELVSHEKYYNVFSSNLLAMRAKREKPIEVKCLKCETIFLKKVSKTRNSPNHFCSRSCSTSYNNTISAKRVISGSVDSVVLLYQLGMSIAKVVANLVCLRTKHLQRLFA